MNDVATQLKTELSRIQGLLDAATDGPWHQANSYNAKEGGSVVLAGVPCSDTALMIALAGPAFSEEQITQTIADGELITESPTLIARLKEALEVALYVVEGNSVERRKKGDKHYPTSKAIHAKRAIQQVTRIMTGVDDAS